MSGVSSWGGGRGWLAAGWTQKVYSWLRESDPPHKHGPHSPFDAMEVYRRFTNLLLILFLLQNDHFDRQLSLIRSTEYIVNQF